MPVLPESPKTWPYQLYLNNENRQRSELLGRFLHTISYMDIKPKYAQGRIAVIGQGVLFPERTILCQGTNFDTLKPEIKLLATFDSAFPTNPNQWLETPVSFGEHGMNFEALPHGTVLNYSWGASYIIREYRLPPNTFDTIFAFQIVDLGEQLQADLLKSIRQILKPGGIFIGSGGRFSDEKFDRLALEQGMNMLQREYLPNPGSAGLFDKHIGIILQKT